MNITPYKFFFISIILLSSIIGSAEACDHTYNVNGYDDNSRYLYGDICANNGDENVSGELYNENGEAIGFDGRWNGHGEISGETDDGVGLELETG